MGASRSFDRMLELSPKWSVTTGTNQYLESRTTATFAIDTQDGSVSGEIWYEVRGGIRRFAGIRLHVNRELITFKKIQVYFLSFQPLTSAIISKLDSLAREHGIPTALEENVSGNSHYHREHLAKKNARKKYG